MLCTDHGADGFSRHHGHEINEVTKLTHDCKDLCQFSLFVMHFTNWGVSSLLPLSSLPCCKLAYSWSWRV